MHAFAPGPLWPAVGSLPSPLLFFQILLTCLPFCLFITSYTIPGPLSRKLEGLRPDSKVRPWKFFTTLGFTT
jgi:hypothetical protein